MDGKAHGKTRVGGGRGEKRADGAARKTQGGAHQILDLDAIVGGGGGAGVNLANGTAEPEHEVHGVNALVHQASAAIKRPRAAPIAGVVVFLSAIPRHAHIGGDEAAQGVFVEQTADGPAGGVETMLRNNGEATPGGALGGEQGVAGRDGDLEGFLDYDMFASEQRLGGEAAVVPARSAKRDHVNGRISKHGGPSRDLE